MKDMTQMRTWAEIDLDALAHNYHALRGMVGAGCQFLGVVKSDAYGHGAVRVAHKLEQLGAEMLAVACLSEAIALRESGIAIPLLCLGATPPQAAELLMEYNIVQMVDHLDTALAFDAAARQAGGQIAVHIKLDTGMGRLGFRWGQGEDNSQTFDTLLRLCAMQGLRLEGLFTHLSDPDGSEAYTKMQVDTFLQAKKMLEDNSIIFPICHCGSSGAVINYSWTHLDMIRTGLALYGYAPDPDARRAASLHLRPVMTVKSRITAIHHHRAGDYISYGRTAQLHSDTTLAVVPIGYGDGYPRSLSGNMDMIVRGRRCPIVGRVCMDMTIVDITAVADAAVGDVALVYADGLTEQAAARANSIVYELLCNLTARIPRIYFEHGKKIE